MRKTLTKFTEVTPTSTGFIETRIGDSAQNSVCFDVKKPKNNVSNFVETSKKIKSTRPTSLKINHDKKFNALVEKNIKLLSDIKYYFICYVFFLI